MRQIFSNFFISDGILKLNYNNNLNIRCSLKESKVKNTKFYSGKKDNYLLNNIYYFLNNNQKVCITYDLSNLSIFTELMVEFLKKYANVFEQNIFIEICLHNDIPFLL